MPASAVCHEVPHKTHQDREVFMKSGKVKDDCKISPAMDDKHLHPFFLHVAIATYVYKTTSGKKNINFFLPCVVKLQVFLRLLRFLKLAYGKQSITGWFLFAGAF